MQDKKVTQWKKRYCYNRADRCIDCAFCYSFYKKDYGSRHACFKILVMTGCFSSVMQYTHACSLFVRSSVCENSRCFHNEEFSQDVEYISKILRVPIEGSTNDIN
jgi:hypothetical protein